MEEILTDVINIDDSDYKYIQDPKERRDAGEKVYHIDAIISKYK